MPKKVSKRKTVDPLSAVRIEPSKTAKQARDDAEQTLADAAVAAAEIVADAPSVIETAAVAAQVRLEKQRVSLPAKVSQKRLPSYKVLVDRTVTWRGQQLRFKGEKSILSDERHGPGAIDKFRAMGVQLEEIK